MRGHAGKCQHDFTHCARCHASCNVQIILLAAGNTMYNAIAHPLCANVTSVPSLIRLSEAAILNKVLQLQAHRADQLRSPESLALKSVFSVQH